MHERVAVLIDGGFFRKRYKEIKGIPTDPKELAKKVYAMAMAHAGKVDKLYRIFYYDCPPLSKKAHNPV